MEGGVTVMKGIKRKPWYILLMMITSVTVCVLMSVNISYPQASKGDKPVVQFYEIGGHLTALNLKEKWALIDDRKWDLSDNFNTKGLEPEWIKTGSFECKNKWVVVRYYVSLPVRSDTPPPDIGERSKEKIIEIINSEEVQDIFERGGKIYKIEVMPA
jgi:hypothetical protein